MISPSLPSFFSPSLFPTVSPSLNVQWLYGDVPYHTKLATVIQVLVFKTEEIPHKPSDKCVFEEREYNSLNLLQIGEKLVSVPDPKPTPARITFSFVG